MRILVISAYAPSLINFRGPLLRELVARGHEVTAAAPYSPGLSRLEDSLASMGVGLYPITLSRGGLDPLADFRTLVNLLNLISKVDPDIILSYAVKPVVYTGLAIRLQYFLGVRAHLRYVALITGLGYAFTTGFGVSRRLLRCFLCYLYGIGLKPTNAIVFQNPDDLVTFESLKLIPPSAEVHRVWGSGVDLTVYSPQPLPPQLVFLMLARLLADKGIREYVCAARQVKRQHPHAIFRLAGMLDLNPAAIPKRELDAWVREGVIEYLGDLPHVQCALAACRFYVLPSYREGTPRSVLEALATARPVITTDAPGCRETVLHGHNGLLVPPRNAGALAAAMLQMIRQSDTETQRMAQASLELARDRFDVQKVNAQLLSVMGA
jgi:glycosyltransferase involved in cell wall biosynthesis